MAEKYQNKLQELNTRLNEIVKLPYDWDGENGPPVDLMRLLYVRQFGQLTFNRPTKYQVPFIVPISGGGIQLEWHMGERYLELEFVDSHVAYLTSDKDCKIVEHDTCSIEAAKITELLDWVHEHS